MVLFITNFKPFSSFNRLQNMNFRTCYNWLFDH